MEKNVVLIGMPGCGKTTIGKILAKKMGREFLDVDDFIFEVTGKDSADYLEKLGDDGFLNFEEAIVDEINKKNAIIACSGSVPLEEEGMGHLKKDAVVVWIDVPEELIEARIKSRIDTDTRIVGAQTMTLDEILKLRQKKYEENNDIHFTLTGDAPAEASADKIFEMINKFNGSGA